ncbi:MAG: hypothetical protein JST16_13130 [Bdellovibrionales bacterium]|nr:hypothetical protein [Bdellovibrionales bacterium]
MRFLSLILCAGFVGALSAPVRAQELTDDETSVDAARDPASTSTKKKKKKKAHGNVKALPSKKLSDTPAPAPKKSGADHSEGWIITRTKDGKIVKVPRKQSFDFKGSEVTGANNRPSQTILGQRPTFRKATLIPERDSFRPEFNDAAGYSAGRSNE